MCGIVGIIDLANRAPERLIFSMNDVIASRGPDGEGFFFCDLNGHQQLSNNKTPPSFKPTVSFGHRRLSIVDLEGGTQPMSNEDNTVWIISNGEIYNHLELRNSLITLGHIFKTDHSDTEVIIHAYEEWGVGGIDRLNGIFGFGILDLKKKRLILARDHFGVKPIYYYFQKESFVFSSEIKAFLACDHIKRELDMDGLNDYLSFRYVPSPRTTFKNIHKIKAGGYLELDLENHQISKIGNYSSSSVVIDENKSFSQRVQEYQDSFERAVKRQLLGDVEVGALLSGGIDSSAVCAIARQHLDYPLRTYTIGFKDFPEGNELEEASRFARYLGTIHKNIIIDNLDFIKVLDEVAWFMDEPTGTSSAIALYHLTKEIKKDVKVVLTGQGADEPLAGYPRYWGERLYQGGFKYLGGLLPLVERLPRQERLKRAFRSFGKHDIFDRFMDVYYLFNPEQKRALLREPIAEEKNALLTQLFEQYTADDNLGRMLYMDTRAWLPDDLLIYGDKATMVNGIEARVPILDKDLVHLIETIPSRLKLSITLQGKFIHKKACKKWLPDFVIKRPKKGFETPIDKWFRNELGGYVKDQLLDGRISRRLFNDSFIKEMINKHQSGKENFQRHLFALLMLEKWADVFDVSL